MSSGVLTNGSVDTNRGEQVSAGRTRRVRQTLSRKEDFSLETQRHGEHRGTRKTSLCPLCLCVSPSKPKETRLPLAFA
jgi:hypothetical protein